MPSFSVTLAGNVTLCVMPRMVKLPVTECVASPSGVAVSLTQRECARFVLAHVEEIFAHQVANELVAPLSFEVGAGNGLHVGNHVGGDEFTVFHRHVSVEQTDSAHVLASHFCGVPCDFGAGGVDFVAGGAVFVVCEGGEGEHCSGAEGHEFGHGRMN